MHECMERVRSGSAARRPRKSGSISRPTCRASQRWALNSLASASTEPLSSFCSPSSSRLDSSARLSLGPAASSAVEIAGAADPQHQPVGRAGLVRRHQGGDLERLGEAERGEDLARPLQGQFQLSGIGVPCRSTTVSPPAFLPARSEIAAASLSLLSLSPSRHSAAAKRIVRSISTTPLVQPAATTPGADLGFRNQGSGALRIDIDVDGLLAGAQRIAGDAEAAEGNLEILSLQALEEIQRRVELDPDADRFRRDFGKILRRRGDAVVGGLVVREIPFR